MGKQIVDGKESLIHTVKGKLIKEEAKAAGDAAVQSDEDTDDVSVSAGRTISLGNYEFARVTLGIKIGLPLGTKQKDKDKAYYRLRDAVEEVLEREEALIRANDKEFKPIDLNGIGIKVAIWLDYGLTFKGKNGDSNKVDISFSRRLSDGSDFEEQLGSLEKELGEKIRDYKALVLGGGEEVGF